MTYHVPLSKWRVMRLNSLSLDLKLGDRDSALKQRKRQIHRRGESMVCRPLTQIKLLIQKGIYKK
jgi:hypothetical protein